MDHLSSLIYDRRPSDDEYRQSEQHWSWVFCLTGAVISIMNLSDLLARCLEEAYSIVQKLHAILVCASER
jgi:hypothetical protein